LRPIDARLNLPAGKGSYLWEEFSQYFCVEQAFGQSAGALDVVLGLDVEQDAQAEDNLVVDILDSIHVSSYVWSAGRAVFGSDEAAVERFVRERLLRIIQGQASGVISGMRRVLTQRKLRGEKRKQVTKTCNHLENNLARMRYDEYLANGYPIAGGVIEGACRHLVKDRMERTGMRWEKGNAGSMLFVRALEVTDLWDQFQMHRQASEQVRLHPHRTMLRDYTPSLSLATCRYLAKHTVQHPRTATILHPSASPPDAADYRLPS